MEEEIVQKIQIEPDKKTISKINTNIFINILIATGVLIYFYFLNLGYINIEKAIFIMDLKVLGFANLAIAIIIFEIAYKKDTGKLAIYGIEALVLAIVTIYLINPYYYMPSEFKKIPVLMPFAFLLYYVAKSIIIHIRGRKQYIKDLSDINEITKIDD